MVRYPLYCAAVALAAALAACTPDPATSFANGREAFAANDYRAARVALISGLREEPGNTDMRLLLARAQLALGDGEGAFATLEKLPREISVRPEVAIIAGEAEVLRGHFDAAIERVTQLETAAADRVRALAYVGLDKPDLAAEAFATGAERAGQDAALLASYARFAQVGGDGAMAASLVGRALKLDPKLIEAHLVRAAILEDEGKLPAALSAYERTLELHPGNFAARVGKGGMLVALDRLKEASALADELSSEAPSDPQTIFLNARIAGRKGDWETVRSILQPEEERLRDDPAMPGLYGQALIELGQPALALGILQPQFKRQPGSRALRRLVARAQLDSKDGAAALATIRPLASRPDATPEELRLATKAAKATGSGAAASFEERIARPSPEWVGGELAKADRALRNRQWRDAETHYEAILSRTGGQNAMVFNNLAFVKDKLGNKEAALDLALKAAKLEPDNASILDTAGWLLFQSGSKAKGREMLRRAAGLDPENATIAKHLAAAEKG